MKIKIVISLCLALLLLPSLALAEQLGLGTSNAGNRNQAINEASHNAMADILLQRLQQQLGADSLTAAWPRLTQEIFKNPASYINNHRILAINQVSGQTWVLLQAQLNEQTFEQLLKSMLTAALPSPAKLDNILCLVVEDVAPGRPALYWWSGQPGLAICPARIERGLKQLGFAPINPSAISAAGLPAEITANVVLGEAQALSLGEQAGSSLVLWGRARVYPILSPDASQSTPLLQLALLSTKEKRMLAQVEVEGGVFRNNLPAGFEDSMDKEVAEALAKLFELAKVEVNPAPLNQIVVELEGLKSAAELSRLETNLLRLHEVVVEVKRESISSGKASLLVSARQDGLALAESLLRAEDAIWLKVEEKTPARLRLSPIR